MQGKGKGKGQGILFRLILVAGLLLTAVEGQLSLNCFKVFQFQGQTTPAVDATILVSDQDLLKEFMTPRMRLLDFKFATQKHTVDKTTRYSLQGLQFYIQGDLNEGFSLKRHGAVDEKTNFYDGSRSGQIPDDIKMIKATQSSDGTIKNVNFIAKADNINSLQIIPGDYLLQEIGDKELQVVIPDNFKLVGLSSRSTADDLKQLSFIFVDTVNVRCLEPSQALLRNITALYLDNDTNQNGQLTRTELNAVMEKLGKLELQPFQTPLTLEHFTSYMMANGIEDNGVLDITGLISNKEVEVVVERTVKEVEIIEQEADSLISNGFAIALIVIVIILLILIVPLAYRIIKAKNQEPLHQSSVVRPKPTAGDGEDLGMENTAHEGNFELYKLSSDKATPSDEKKFGRQTELNGLETKNAVHFESDERFERSDRPSDRPISEEEGPGPLSVPLKSLNNKMGTPSQDHRRSRTSWKETNHRDQQRQGSQQLLMGRPERMSSQNGGGPPVPQMDHSEAPAERTSKQRPVSRPEEPNTQAILYNGLRIMQQVRKIRSPRNKFESDSEMSDF